MMILKMLGKKRQSITLLGIYIQTELHADQN